MGISSKSALGASYKYTDEAVAGGGAIKGKNCVIDSIVEIEGGNRITFKWTLDNGTVQTETMDVMDGIDGRGILKYNTMPSIADLFALPNYTVFETDGFWEQADGNGGKYLISTIYGTGTLKLENNGSTRYLYALDERGGLLNHIDVCRYGIRGVKRINGTLDPTTSYATQNSAILSNFVNAFMDATLVFPRGKFVFESPFNLSYSNRVYAITGAGTPNVRTDASSSSSGDWDIGTMLVFPFLTDGQIALRGSANIENLAVVGSLDTYNIEFDRTKTITAPNEVVTETIAESGGTPIKCTGIYKQNVGYIKNVFVYGFYTGVEVQTSNTMVQNLFIRKCHFGITMGNDVKCIGIYGWDVHTFIKITGSISSVVQARIDNSVHALHLYSGKGITVSDIDADYCTEEMILIGDTDSNSKGADGVRIENVHGRYGTLKSFDKTQMPDGYDVRNLVDTSGYGLIRVIGSSIFRNSHISVNYYGTSNPFDTTSNYLCPNIIFTFDSSKAYSVMTNNTFEIGSPALTSDDTLKIIQTRANNTARVDVSSGTYFIEGASVRASNDKRYNVLDYGLKGDKTTDNTSALRNLISLIPNGSVIFFPVGTYVITEGIEINKDVTFLGENEEMQTAGTAPNRIHDPMSIIKYGGNTANVTMFTKASGYYDVNFVNLTLDGGNSYDVTDNWTGTFTTLPFYNQLETTNLAGINGLDVSILSPGIVKNCMFWGFSGYGVKIAQHKYVERCGFYKCKKGIVTKFSDSLLHDLWFCKCGTAIYMLPKENDTFASVNVSDIWADQLIDHLVEADSLVTSAQIITSNAWVDSVGKSAFYLPEATVSRAHIQGTFGRIGMDYAGIADADRTSALAQYTDFLACGRLIYSTLELNISNVTIGKGSNANGECFSRLITTYKASNNNEHNKIICNSFPVARLYDSNTQPQYGYFADTEYNGIDGNVLIYTGSTYANGFFTYTNSPVGRCIAPSKDFLVYDRLAKKLYRSTAGGNNTAWAEIVLSEPDPSTDIDFSTVLGGN